MATSRLTKRTKAVRQIATGTGAGGGQTRLQLNRDWLVSEHKINVNVSQANAGVDPTSVDVRDFISSISLETSDGRRVYLTGAQAYDLGRFTESASAVTSSLGAVSTAAYAFEIHHENDGALLDLLTALRSNEFSTIDLVINWAADSLNGFKGQTVPAAAAYSVRVESYDYEMLTPETLGVQFGQVLGSWKHYQNRLGAASGTGTGTQADIQLVTGGAMRFLTMHAYDTATVPGVPTLSDAIVGNLRININGRDYRVTNFLDLKQDNVARRGFNQTGVAVIDFGDDEAGWLDLSAVSQARLTWDVLAGAPAGWTVEFAQDYVTRN